MIFFSAEKASSETDQALVKVPAMIIMFLMTMIFGSLPLRLKAFKENKLVLALANAFSGGLFLAIGLMHLLPEANENFEDYYDEEFEKEQKKNPDAEKKEHFPFPFLITVLSFTLILFIEKIATDHHHSHGDEPNAKSSILKSFTKSSFNNKNKNGNGNEQMLIEQQSDLIMESDIQQMEDEEIEQLEEEVIKESLSHQRKIVRSFAKSSFVNAQGELEIKLTNDFTPYLLQIAIGIHAIFEGIAIGLQADWAQALGIALAVVGHKWAEAITLGISFRNADIPLKKATYFILIQAVMNPVGVGIGWALSNSGELLTGTFTSISAGTFVYIACMEVIVEEFALKRYKWQKFGMFLIAIGFVCCLWVFEQLAGE